ncbi:hypothetical protein GOP47_0016481 [Adiantum capillus-veneris]|uniref:RRM domain-containing protein n=1 Tax=Adiantum capillus-veneris TaxID=13818 RepID=A0A9D4UHR6_ADICA|nr:hypothetical protein GOP47_0016481 [Adiantum capillus-veneris]
MCVVAGPISDQPYEGSNASLAEKTSLESSVIEFLKKRGILKIRIPIDKKSVVINGFAYVDFEDKQSLAPGGSGGCGGRRGRFGGQVVLPIEEFRGRMRWKAFHITREGFLF